MDKNPTAKEIWNTLSAIDVSEKVEKKGGLSYLSWAWAWATLMEKFPQAQYEFIEYQTPDGRSQSCMFFPDGSAEVHCFVTIGNVSRYMWLPVMDYRSKSVLNPTSREISDCKMRCLTKCISMHGLGSYIYAGEDTPTAPEPEETEEKKSVSKKASKTKKTKANGAEKSSVFVAHKSVIDAVQSKEELMKHFSKNKNELEKLKKSKPDVVKAITDSLNDKLNEFAN